MTIRVVLCDDQPLMRAALRTVLVSAGIQVEGEAADGTEALELGRLHRPDVVLMDVRMPGRDGLSAAAELALESPPIPVLVLTTFDLDEYLYGALRAGASGFLLKNASPEELVQAIGKVASGGCVLDPVATRRIMARFAQPAIREPLVGLPSAAAIESLTEREKDVLALLARGLNNGEVAKALRIGEATAKSHVSSVLSKLGVRDRVQAVIYAYEARFAPTNRPGI